MPTARARTKFYVWNEAEVDALIGEKSSDFKRVYNVDADGNWEGKTILNRLHSMELLDDATEAEMAAGRKILLHARAHRIRPGKDTKVLADWNGLMIAALAFASHVFDRPKWRELAQQAYDFVGTAMRPNGRLLHSWCAGEARHPATWTITQISPVPPSPLNVRAKIDIGRMRNPS